MTTTPETPETPGVPAGLVLDGLSRELATMTRRAVTAEAMVAHLIAASEQDRATEPDA